jgi:hypothetical protein
MSNTQEKKHVMYVRHKKMCRSQKEYWHIYCSHNEKLLNLGQKLQKQESHGLLDH